MSDIQGLNSKHMATGSQQPSDPASGKIRVYNMRFCPYAQRALLALSLKHLPFEVININLADKPEWYGAKKNPLAKVPTLEHDGKVVYESLVCADYVNDVFNKDGRQLLPTDPYERAKQRMLTERLTALPGALYPFYRNTGDEPQIKNLEKAFELYESLLQQNGFFAGKEPGYADYMSWPWVERLSAVELMSNKRVAITKDKYPKFAAYIERMAQIPEIKAILIDGPTHMKFLESAFKGGKADYDILAK